MNKTLRSIEQPETPSDRDALLHLKSVILKFSTLMDTICDINNIPTLLPQSKSMDILILIHNRPFGLQMTKSSEKKNKAVYKTSVPQHPIIACLQQKNPTFSLDDALFE